MKVGRNRQVENDEKTFQSPRTNISSALITELSIPGLAKHIITAVNIMGTN